MIYLPNEMEPTHTIEEKIKKIADNVMWGGGQVPESIKKEFLHNFSAKVKKIR